MDHISGTSSDGGIFLVIRESWKGQLSALPVCILTAGAGILCCVLAEIMRERMRFATAIAGLPWIVLLVFTGAFRGGWTGAQAWINMLISQWNTADGGRSGIIFCAGVHA